MPAIIFLNMFVATQTARSPATLAAAVSICLLMANYVAGVMAVKSDPRGEAGESAARSSRFLIQGGLLSLLAMGLVSNRLEPGDGLMQVTNFFLGLGYAIGGGMFALGIGYLWRLWKELVPQFRGIHAVLLLKALPMSVLWLAVGCGGFMSMGLILEKMPLIERSYIFSLIFKVVFWGLLGFGLLRLWSDRGMTALLTRTYLLVFFTAVMLAAVAFYFLWLVEVPEWPLAYLASTASLLAVLFYFQMQRAAKKALLS